MALFTLNIPDGLPISPVLGQLSGSGLSGFTQYYLPFGALNGSLTEDVDLQFNGTNLLVGSDSNTTDFPNARAIFSNGNSGHSYANNAAIVGESVAAMGYPAIGIGGVAKGVDGMPAYGVAGRGLPETSASSGPAIGVEGLSEATHTGGSNIAFYAIATNGSLNYSFFGNSGNFYNNGTGHFTGNLSSDAAISAFNFKSDVYYNAAGSKSLAYVSGSNYWTIDANFFVSGNTDLTGTVTVSSMGIAGIVKNTADGLLSGGNTITVSEINDISTNYLKLDCSNDPLTGTLQTSDELDINGTTEYLKQEEW